VEVIRRVGGSVEEKGVFLLRLAEARRRKFLERNDPKGKLSLGKGRRKRSWFFSERENAYGGTDKNIKRRKMAAARRP